jgi:hypothetical protein
MKAIPLTPLTLDLARRIIWFEPPEQALSEPIRFMAYAMTYARHEDMRVICPVPALAVIEKIRTVSMLSSEQVCEFFGDHHRRRIGVAANEPRHNGSVRDPQTFHAPHPQLAVDHGRRVGSHDRVNRYRAATANSW